MEVYVVKSGRMAHSGDWQWQNLAVFDDHDGAVDYVKVIEKQIKPIDLDETETVEIESFYLRSY